MSVRDLSQDTFKLHLVCSMCSYRKTSCCHNLPCKACGTRRECIPHTKEWLYRSRAAFRRVVDGVYPHNDIAKRELYLQCNTYDVSHRIRRSDLMALTGDGEFNPLTKEEMETSAIPEMMRSIMDTSSTWKLEWMRDGVYSMTVGDGYKDSIIDGDEVNKLTSIYSVPPKMVDTMNCNNVDLVYLMWCETLVSTGIVARRTDLVYWKSIKTVKPTMIEMVSFYSKERGIMTLTRLSKIKR